MEHVIRNASIDDADAIGAVVARAWQAAYRGIMPDDYLDRLRPEQRAAMWQPVLADLGPNRWVRVLTVGDELVGFASCGPELADVGDGETGELYAINLDPDHWGRGLGRALLAEVTRGLLMEELSRPVARRVVELLRNHAIAGGNGSAPGAGSVEGDSAGDAGPGALPMNDYATRFIRPSANDGRRGPWSR